MKRDQIYKCNVCGNIIRLNHIWWWPLVCCGQPMNEINEWTVDASLEKHVPVIEKTDDGILVKVGSVPHPMEESHYIEWIEIIDGEKVYVEYLKPWMKPEVFFPIKYHEWLIAREYCNLHWLRKN